MSYGIKVGNLTISCEGKGISPSPVKPGLRREPNGGKGISPSPVKPSLRREPIKNKNEQEQKRNNSNSTAPVQKNESKKGNYR